jgi:hypothetical protein
MRTLLNFLLFQAGWFAAILLAARDLPLAAAGSVVGFVILHLVFVDDLKAELAMILPAIPMGFLVDSALTTSGALSYRGQFSPNCPPWWIPALWLLFAATFRHSSRWMLGRPKLSALLGIAGAPLSYAAAERLGAVTIGEPLAKSVASISVLWGFALALGAIYGNRFRPIAAETAPEPAAGNIGASE